MGKLLTSQRIRYPGPCIGQQKERDTWFCEVGIWRRRRREWRRKHWTTDSWKDETWREPQKGVNWKLLFKNVGENISEWKSTYKNMKCFLKIKNYFLKTPIKHPLSPSQTYFLCFFFFFNLFLFSCYKIKIDSAIHIHSLFFFFFYFFLNSFFFEKGVNETWLNYCH